MARHANLKGGNFLLENSTELSMLGIVVDNYRWGDFMSDLWPRNAQCSFFLSSFIISSLPSNHTQTSISSTDFGSELGCNATT